MPTSVFPHGTPAFMHDFATLECGFFLVNHGGTPTWKTSVAIMDTPSMSVRQMQIPIKLGLQPTSARGAQNACNIWNPVSNFPHGTPTRHAFGRLLPPSYVKDFYTKGTPFSTDGILCPTHLSLFSLSNFRRLHKWWRVEQQGAAYLTDRLYKHIRVNQTEPTGLKSIPTHG